MPKLIKRYREEGNIMKRNSLNAYKQTSVQTAGQPKLIVMLYDEAIRQIDSAKILIDSEKKDYEKISKSIIKAQNIVTELMVSLDFDKGGDIAKNLFNLYMFFNQQLIEANMQKNSEKLQDVKSLMCELASAWKEIEHTVLVQPSKPVAGINIAG